MDRNKTLDLVNEMLSQAKKEDLTNILKEVRDYVTVLKSQTYTPLTKAISEITEDLKKAEVNKVDPHTRLPGTMLDKGDGGNTMGSSNMSITPMAKDSPDSSSPMAANQDKKAQLAQRMKKCMKTLTASEPMKKDGMSISGSPEAAAPASGPTQTAPAPMGGIVMGGKKKKNLIGSVSVKVDSPMPAMKSEKLTKPVPEGVSKEKFDSCVDDVKAKGGKYNAYAVCNTSLKKDGGYGSVTVIPDRPTPIGSVIMKDDKPHQAGSPQDKAHDIVEEGSPIKEAISHLNHPDAPTIHKMFQHLRNRKQEGQSWERSPKNEAVGMDKSEPNRDPKDITAEAKRAVVEPADKPMKVAPERPGQASKPVSK